MRHRHLLACVTFCVTISIGLGCAPRSPVPEPDDRPQGISGVEAIRISEDMFQAPPGQIRVFTTTRQDLDARRRPATRGEDFDSAARPLFYMGSDDDWDYYHLADHAFGQFWRVRREHNPQDGRTPLTGNSSGWREVTETVGATTKPDRATTKPDAATTKP
jgi:hypothetical protein